MTSKKTFNQVFSFLLQNSCYTDCTFFAVKMEEHFDNIHMCIIIIHTLTFLVHAFEPIFVFENAKILVIQNIHKRA